MIATAVTASFFSPVFDNSTNAFRNLAVATRGSSNTFFSCSSPCPPPSVTFAVSGAGACAGVGTGTCTCTGSGSGSVPERTYILFVVLYEISSKDFADDIDLPPYHRIILPIGATPISASVFLTLCNCSVSLTMSLMGVPTIELSGWATSNITAIFFPTAVTTPPPPIIDPIALVIVFINPLPSLAPSLLGVGVGISISRFRNSVLSIFAGSVVAMTPFAGFASILRSGLSFFIIHSNTRRPPSSFICAGLM